MKRLIYLNIFYLFFSSNVKSQIDFNWQQHIFNVYFNKNSDLLSSESSKLIRQSLLNIGTVNIRKIQLKGFADSDNTDSFNLQLSSKRAKKVYNFLITQAVPQSMIEMESLGETMPISEVKSLNRRVEIIISYEVLNYRNLNQKSSKLIVKGKVSNKNTGLPLASTIVIDYKKQTFFSSSPSNGKFLLSPYLGALITFSRDGFLNNSIILNDSIIKQSNDTVFLDIKLKPIEVTEKIVFEKIYFYSDSDSLKPESKPDLLHLLNIMKNDKNIIIEIQGHMNCPLSYPMNNFQKKYNHELSYKRAKAVYNFLVKNGIAASRLTYKGMSNFKMIFQEPKNDAEADRNKRVEVWKLKVIEN
ncbi:MAG: OmpA family protein [Bacteroidetes bacterium]|nr:OmpA family protein [Bacteroidota bacterium]